MSDALPVAICKSIVTQLNSATAGTFDAAFTAVRAYRPGYTTEQAKTLRVTIVPGEVTPEIIARAGTAEDAWRVDVAFHKALEGDETAQNATTDTMLRVVEQVRDYLASASVRAAIKTATTASITDIANAPIYSGDDWKAGMFVSVLQITLKG